VKLIVLFGRFHRWLWGFRLFRSYGDLCNNRETGRSTCSPLSGFGHPLFPVLYSPHNGFKIHTPIGVGSATPACEPVFKHSVGPLLLSGYSMSASAAPLSGPCEAHCPFRPLSRWLWGFRLFRSYGGLCSNRETGRSTCSLLSGFGRSLFPVLDSPHNGFKIHTPIGVGSATPLRTGF
jgi:hypothetical protein